MGLKMLFCKHFNKEFSSDNVCLKFTLHYNCNDKFGVLKKIRNFFDVRDIYLHLKMTLGINLAVTE